jgi:hypothetical protein
MRMVHFGQYCFSVRGISNNSHGRRECVCEVITLDGPFMVQARSELEIDEFEGRV